MKDVNLKPCPFCGAEARMWQWNGGTRIDCSRWVWDDSGDIHFVGVGSRNREAAIELWNTRCEREVADGEHKSV